jgi:hypothetical protein
MVDQNKHRRKMPETQSKIDVLYRYREEQVDQIYDPRPREAVKAMRLYLDSYPILKFTRCGCWIDIGSRKKFVNLDKNKKWAHDSLEDAMISFIARKKRQAFILRNQLVRAEASLFLKAEDARNLRMGMYQFQEDPSDGF